jgi:hypothetical protein
MQINELSTLKMTDNYSFPITPPPELVQQWVDTYFGGRISHVDLAAQVAQWGADQELEACCKWLKLEGHEHEHEALLAARRLKPASLKEQALEIMRGTPVNSAGLYSYEHVEIIRRALEQLDD